MNKRSFFSILLLFSSFVYGEIAETNFGPVHEAFVTKEQGQEVLQAIAKSPPQPLHEIEKIGGNGKIWIGGYWAFSQELGDFVWVSGVLRKPPPNHHWVSGRWRELSHQFVWIPGYWTANEKDEKLSIAPPPTVNELVPAACSSDYFWAQGFWEFSQKDQNFHWKKGRWEKFSSWVFVPARYVTTGSSFVFIPAYWDYSLENRGELFANIYVPEEEREKTIFSPVLKVTNEQVIQKLFGTYPEYLVLFQNFLYTQPNYFVKKGVEPTWWNWQSYWTLPYYDHLALFWWWSHPSYPAPSWVTNECRAAIAPASKELVKWMKKIPPPVQVTKAGILTSFQLLKATRLVLKENIAILPADAKLYKQIITEAKSTKVIKTTSEKIEPVCPPQKPNHTLPLDQYPSLPSRMSLPPYPNEEIALLKPEPQVRYPLEVDKHYPSSFPPDSRFYEKQRMEFYNYYEDKNAAIRQKNEIRNRQNEKGYFEVPEDSKEPFDNSYPQNEKRLLEQKKSDDDLLPPRDYRYSDQNYYSDRYRIPRRENRYRGTRGPEPTKPLQLQHRDFIHIKPQDNL